MRVVTLNVSPDILGESPVWSDEEQALYWVDMLGRSIRRYEFATGRVDEWKTPGTPTAIALNGRGGLIVALDSAVCLFQFNGRYETLCKPLQNGSGQRFNEGKCDSEGRFWVGSMTNNIKLDGSILPVTQKTGAIYRVESNGSCVQVTDATFGIINTMVWPSNGRTFMTADSLDNAIYMFDYESEEGAISNKKRLPHGVAPGVPDGSALDCEDMLWNARFGGRCLARWTTSGTLHDITSLHVTNPTSCTFGGPNLDILFVTSARVGLRREILAQSNDEGTLFAIETNTRGMRSVPFAN